jgi:hypothetical protein
MRVATVVATVLLVLVGGLMLSFVLRRYAGNIGRVDTWDTWLPEEDEDGWEDWGSGGVREPRRPLPSGGAAAVALPEPDDRAA